MSRNIERPSPKTYHITTLHNTAFYVTHDTFIGELFPPKIVKHILGFSGGTKGDGEVKRNWKPRYCLTNFIESVAVFSVIGILFFFVARYNIPG